MGDNGYNEVDEDGEYELHGGGVSSGKGGYELHGGGVSSCARSSCRTRQQTIFLPTLGMTTTVIAAMRSIATTVRRTIWTTRRAMTSTMMVTKRTPWTTTMTPQTRTTTTTISFTRMNGFLKKQKGKLIID